MRSRPEVLILSTTLAGVMTILVARNLCNVPTCGGVLSARMGTGLVRSGGLAAGASADSAAGDLLNSLTADKTTEPNETAGERQLPQINPV